MDAREYPLGTDPSLRPALERLVAMVVGMMMTYQGDKPSIRIFSCLLHGEVLRNNRAKRQSNAVVAASCPRWD